MLNPVATALGMMLVAVLALMSSLHAEEMVLWWQVGDPNDPDSLSDVIITTFMEGDKTAAEMGVTDARIKVVGTDNYLTMMEVEGSADSAATVPTDWYASVVSPYASAEYSFAIELGNYDYQTGTWTMIAASETMSYTSLVEGGHIVDWETIDADDPVVWNPTTYVVPEPSSGLLVLLGGALLALRRKRRD